MSKVTLEVLAAKIDDLKDKIDKMDLDHVSALNRVEKQVLLTNGRVTKLEIKEGRQAVINAILSLIGGATLAGLIGIIIQKVLGG